MGGDSFFPSTTSTDDESLLLGVESPLDSCDHEGLSTKLDIGPLMNVGSGLTSRKSLLHETAEKQKRKVYEQIWKTYDVEVKIGRLEEARSKVLSYTPGSWAEKANGLDWDEHDVPKTTSLLLIGPKASGKSSLVNKISEVLEDGMFTSARAPVSKSALPGYGTYFCHQYIIPRGSGSFCLCDTRGLSNDPCENFKMLKRWRKKGVQHGELIRRESDSEGLKAQLKCKAKGLQSPSKRIPFNFVIFVVNGISVLDAMDGDDGTKRDFFQQIATIFNDPLLSFKDDKPVVVVTHGDLLSLSDCVRIRFYLGELLCIPPAHQIFDIPESNDIVTELTILDMLSYCLEHADRNLLAKKQHADRNLPAKKQAAVEISEPWWAFLPVVLFSLVLVGSLLNHAHQASIRNRTRFFTPANKSEFQGGQGCYPCSPSKESQENGLKGSYYHHAPTNQSEKTVQGSHPHEPAGASQKIGAQACPSCEPYVASLIIGSHLSGAPTSEKRAQEDGIPASRPHVLYDESLEKGVLKDHVKATQRQAPSNAPKQNGAQASQTYLTANKNGFPTSRADESQKKGVQEDHVQASQPEVPSNAPKQNSAQASQAHERSKKSSKKGATHHRVPADAINRGEAMYNFTFKWKKKHFVVLFLVMLQVMYRLNFRSFVVLYLVILSMLY